MGEKHGRQMTLAAETTVGKWMQNGKTVTVTGGSELEFLDGQFSQSPTTVDRLALENISLIPRPRRPGRERGVCGDDNWVNGGDRWIHPT